MRLRPCGIGLLKLIMMRRKVDRVQRRFQVLMAWVLWKHIRRGWDSFAEGLRFKVGAGLKVRFWYDIWCGDQPLKLAFPSLFSITRYKEAWVKDNFIWKNGSVEWDVIFVWSVQDWELDVVLSFFDQLYSCEISHGNIDQIYWSHSTKGKFEVKSFYKALSNLDHEVFPWKSIWHSKVPSRGLWL
jgi:hypothetical protein